MFTLPGFGGGSSAPRPAAKAETVEETKDKEKKAGRRRKGFLRSVVGDVNGDPGDNGAGSVGDVGGEADNR